MLGFFALFAIFGGDLFGSGGDYSSSTSENNDVDELADPSLDNDSQVIEELGERTLTNTNTLLVVDDETGPLTWSEPYAGETTTAEEVDAFEAAWEQDIDTREDFEDYAEEIVMPQFSGELVTGTDGSDRIFGTDGEDVGIGWRGDDSIFLGDGNDRLIASFAAESAGDDFIRGGNGQDTLVDHLGEDTLRGDGGNDTVDARDHELDPGADILFGGFGNDLLVGDDCDTLEGGAGMDGFHIFVQSGSADAVTISDYNPADESIVVFVEADTPMRSGEYDLDLVANGSDTHILVEGRLVAVLEDVTQADVRGVQIGNYRIS
ncbi:MAG: hypothetical protein P8P65_01625 [Planktotalea sp.]|uniref:calcium-binding protein n=1 Tax=Planktotalea sp. TaxID=2029877 RepID=UPI000ECBB232|nr:hypothetical protein [Planktotalea sp.]MDG1075339.1 hypothetical protein [Planktotalea sp.]MDG1083691.1 hypothetical protein [Planktotalea sp.]HCW85171.1 hypothetical protein [Paracoccaceae bacterium]